MKVKDGEVYALKGKDVIVITGEIETEGKYRGVLRAYVIDCHRKIQIIQHYSRTDEFVKLPKKKRRIAVKAIFEYKLVK